MKGGNVCRLTHLLQQSQGRLGVAAAEVNLGRGLAAVELVVSHKENPMENAMKNVENMDVSKNGATQPPWVFLLKMIILWCFGGTPIFGNTHMGCLLLKPKRFLSSVGVCLCRFFFLMTFLVTLKGGFGYFFQSSVPPKKNVPTHPGQKAPFFCNS